MDSIVLEEEYKLNFIGIAFKEIFKKISKYVIKHMP